MHKPSIWTNTSLEDLESKQEKDLRPLFKGWRTLSILWPVHPGETKHILETPKVFTVSKAILQAAFFACQLVPAEPQNKENSLEELTSSEKPRVNREPNSST